MKLESHQFISFFDPQQAQQLCQLAIIEQFTDGTIIFEEGEIPDFLYLVLDGKVEFRKATSYGQYQEIAKALPDEFFGEFGIIDGQPRSAQVVVCGWATLAKIPRHSLMEILHNTSSSVVLKLFGYVTQRLRATTEDYVKELVHKDKMVLVGEMVNTIIHDFKSPLSSIHLSNSVLKEMYEDEETQEWCDLIQIQAQRMSAMAEELLEFARGQAVLTKHPVNLAFALEQFEKLNRVYFQEFKVEFIVEAQNTIVSADENKLLRVWQNLVGNAVEAFGGRGGQIYIKVTENHNQAQIQIQDNGPGIPEQIRDRFFDSFVTCGKEKGTGLGTAIVKSIIDAHGGSISFDSSSQGTTFYLTLPLMKLTSDHSSTCEVGSLLTSPDLSALSPVTQ